jgi:hypothetical protein
MTRITAALEGLKQNPLALAMVLTNVTFLLAGIYIMRDISVTMREREARNTTLLEKCLLNRS